MTAVTQSTQGTSVGDATGGSTAAAQLIRREGDYWTIAFAGSSFRMRDTVGLHDLAYLLRRPHEDVSSLDIFSARAGLKRDLRAESEGDPGAPLPLAVARERARINVTRSLAGTLKRIAVHHPHLGQHLRATLRTGLCCSYRPDPRLPTRWEG